MFFWNIGQLVAGLVTLPAGGMGAIILLVFGAFELVYVIPLAVIARNAGERERMKGIVIMGSIGFILTGACWGTALILLSNAKF